MPAICRIQGRVSEIEESAFEMRNSFGVSGSVAFPTLTANDKLSAGATLDNQRHGSHYHIVFAFLYFCISEFVFVFLFVCVFVFVISCSFSCSCNLSFSCSCYNYSSCNFSYSCNRIYICK